MSFMSLAWLTLALSLPNRKEWRAFLPPEFLSHVL